MSSEHAADGTQKDDVAPATESDAPLKERKALAPPTPEQCAEFHQSIDRGIGAVATYLGEKQSEMFGVVDGGMLILSGVTYAAKIADAHVLRFLLQDILSRSEYVLAKTILTRDELKSACSEEQLEEIRKQRIFRVVDATEAYYAAHDMASNLVETGGPPERISKYRAIMGYLLQVAQVTLKPDMARTLYLNACARGLMQDLQLLDSQQTTAAVLAADGNTLELGLSTAVALGNMECAVFIVGRNCALRPAPEHLAATHHFAYCIAHRARDAGSTNRFCKAYANSYALDHNMRMRIRRSYAEQRGSRIVCDIKCGVRRIAAAYAPDGKEKVIFNDGCVPPSKNIHEE